MPTLGQNVKAVINFFMRPLRARSGHGKPNKETRTNLLGISDFGRMKLSHAGIKIERDRIIDREEMDLDRGRLANTDSASTCLMNNGRIPVLGQKENTATEL